CTMNRVTFSPLFSAPSRIRRSSSADARKLILCDFVVERFLTTVAINRAPMYVQCAYINRCYRSDAQLSICLYHNCAIRESLGGSQSSQTFSFLISGRFPACVPFRGP